MMRWLMKIMEWIRVIVVMGVDDVLMWCEFERGREMAMKVRMSKNKKEKKGPSGFALLGTERGEREWGEGVVTKSRDIGVASRSI